MKKLTFKPTKTKSKPKVTGGRRKYAAAVNAVRKENHKSLDSYFSPPYTARALPDFLNDNGIDTHHSTCLEPACGLGHMALALSEYFEAVDVSDIYDWHNKCAGGPNVYQLPYIHDFLASDYPVEAGAYDWVITNPPFNKAKDFVLKALDIATQGVAVLVRTAFIESQSRYEDLYKDKPPTLLLQFSERAGMVKGTVDRHVQSSVSYCWLVWLLPDAGERCMIDWLPPGTRARLEREHDYPFSDNDATPVEKEKEPETLL